jgi:hypothetical protein
MEEGTICFYSIRKESIAISFRYGFALEDNKYNSLWIRVWKKLDIKVKLSEDDFVDKLLVLNEEAFIDPEINEKTNRIRFKMNHLSEGKSIAH